MTLIVSLLIFSSCGLREVADRDSYDDNRDDRDNQKHWWAPSQAAFCLTGKFMLTGKHSPLPSIRAFVSRIIRNLIIGFAIIAFSLGIGMVGYSYYEKMGWIDAFLNASMILSGMGPVSTLQTDAGKMFAGFYALFSGIIFLVVIAIIMAPLFHRFLHKFHVKDMN